MGAAIDRAHTAAEEGLANEPKAYAGLLDETATPLAMSGFHDPLTVYVSLRRFTFFVGIFGGEEVEWTTWLANGAALARRR